jgi:hypothetical protein
MKELKFSIAALATTISVSALAGTGTGKVTGIIVGPTLIFSVENSHNRPTCAVSGEFTIDGSTPEGKNTLALILSAASQGKSITIVGSGKCTETGIRESVSYVAISY